MPIEAFTWTAAEAALRDLRERLRRTRWPDAIAGSGWDYGVDLDVLRRMCAFWAEEFDWRAWERLLAGLPQIRCGDESGLAILALHWRGEGRAPLPLLLTHGWPGSFLEFLELAPRLAYPSRYGGEAADAFDVVAPSLPGFGFSSRPADRGVNPEAIAEIWVRLMRALGYERFGAQGGDIGASVTLLLGLRHPKRLSGIHLNYIPFSYRPAVEGALTAAEEDYLARRAQWAEQHGAYAHMQRREPTTAAVGLNDSPAGLAAWLLGRFHAWSPPEPGIEAPERRDHLPANLTLYWLTETIASSFRLYWEMARAPLVLGAAERVRTPVGVARFPYELPLPPREWVERGCRVERWTEMARGGHFAALDEPGLLAAELREFFRPLREG